MNSVQILHVILSTGLDLMAYRQRMASNFLQQVWILTYPSLKISIYLLFIKQGGSTFKMVVGTYGGGKTHFLYCVRDLAWESNFVVSYVSLSSGESPFHKLELVYRAIVQSIVPPLLPEELLSEYERGIDSFLSRWFSQSYQEFQKKGLSGESLREELLKMVEDIKGIESISFAKAVKAAFRAKINKKDEDFDNICQWLNGENYDRRIHASYGILQRIDKTTAFTMIRSLSQWIRQIGYSGVVVLLDEAEKVPSLTTKNREQYLNNLREIIDECGHTTFKGVMIFYAVPDESFLEGRAQIYEALKQRVTTTFEGLNPTGVKIELEKVISDRIPFLCEIGSKLAKVYEIAYNHKFKESAVQQTIKTVAESSHNQRFGDIGYKRLFVQTLIRGFHFLRQKGTPPTDIDLR